LSRLTPYAEEIIEDQQCGLQCNRSTTVHTFCICKMLIKKLEYNETVYQPFTDYKNAYNSVGNYVLHNNPTNIGKANKNLFMNPITELGRQISV
jgi:hypothetical protein